MKNQQLADYIKEQLQKGKSKEEIKQELLNSGWQNSDISEAFNNNSNHPPLPPSMHKPKATGLKQLDAKVVWLFFIRLVLRWCVIIVILGFYTMIYPVYLRIGSGTEGIAFGALSLILFIVISIIIIFLYVWARLMYRFYRYELQEDGFRKELGVIYKKYVTIPYDRIQNVDINRGILARILGLSDLNIQTAGASASISRFGASGVVAEGRLPGLSRKTAEQVRDELIKRARQAKNQGL